MAMPIGRFLTEIHPEGKQIALSVIRGGNVLWEAKSTVHEAELGTIIEGFPYPGCRSLLMSTHTGGGNCCFSEALVTDCDKSQVLAAFSPGHSALEMEQTGSTWVVHALDWSFAYYMLDKKRNLPFGVAQPITRVLSFDPDRGWKPDDPGDFPKLHRLLQRDMENTTTPDMPDQQRAARAIAASAHVLLAGGTDTAVRQALARLLPSSWLRDLDTVLSDVIKTVSTYDPAENQVYYN